MLGRGNELNSFLSKRYVRLTSLPNPIVKTTTLDPDRNDKKDLHYFIYKRMKSFRRRRTGGRVK